MCLCVCVNLFLLQWSNLLIVFLLKVYLSLEPVCWLVGRSVARLVNWPVGWSVCHSIHSILKRQESYTSMLLSEHLLITFLLFHQAFLYFAHLSSSSLSPSHPPDVRGDFPLPHTPVGAGEGERAVGGYSPIPNYRVVKCTVQTFAEK